MKRQLELFEKTLAEKQRDQDHAESTPLGTETN
jgi:hypothetical protein